MANHLLLTGATGQVGQYLLRDLLLEGQDLAVLIRSQPHHSAKSRLDKIIAHWERELGRRLPHPHCLEGDITRGDLGLSTANRHWVAEHCDALLHNAASLSFIGSDRLKDPWRSNFDGTRHVLEFMRANEIHRLHYVSTAYVCGKRAGLIREDELDCGQDFRNDYEESKCAAEKLVRSADDVENLTVYRPAMIVGDSVTGYTATYHGLYPYLQFAHVFSQLSERDEAGRWHAPVRLNVTGDERRNLVPIDWVSAVMAHIILHPKCHGLTYHLTPKQPVTARTVEEAMSESFGYYGPQFVGPDGLTPPLNDLEKQFYEYVSTYQPYWNQEPVFDCSNTRPAAPHLPCPVIDVPVLRRLIDYAVKDRWGKGPVRTRTKSEKVKRYSHES